MRFEKNNNAELIRFQFTDDTRQTLESVTVFLKDRFAEYGYLPETDVIPIGWIRNYIEKKKKALRLHDDFNDLDEIWGIIGIESLLEEWEKENGDSKA